MVRWRHEDEDNPTRLARRAAATRLGAEATGLETAGHCRRAGGDARRCQPVAQAGPGAGGRGVATPSFPGPPAATHRRAGRPPAGAPRAGTRSIRVPGAGLDVPAGGGGHPAHLWRHLPPSPRQPAAPHCAPERPTPGPACRSARCGGHHGLVARALAGLGKKATDEGRTIVWVDQSGFYLLPLAVRTWAPCGQTPVLQVPLTHDHLSAISGITPQGRLFMQTQDHA